MLCVAGLFDRIRVMFPQRSLFLWAFPALLFAFVNQARAAESSGAVQSIRTLSPSSTNTVMNAMVKA